MDENKRNTLMNCFFTLLLSASACSSPIIAQNSYHYYSNPAKVGSANEKAFSHYKRAYYDHIWQWSTEGVDSAIYYIQLELARIYAITNELEKSIEFLTKAKTHLNEFVTAERFLTYLRGSDFDALRKDTRFLELLSTR